MAIGWTKKFTSSDDGSLLTGQMLGNLQADIQAKFSIANTGLSSSDFASNAGIIASKLDLTNANGVNMTYSSGNYPKKSVILTARNGIPSTSSGCATPVKVEYGTNDIDMWHLDFDKDTDEYAQWTITMPDNWDVSTIAAIFYWTETGAGAAETVTWGIQGRSYANDDPIDAAWGTAKTIADTRIAANDVHISSTTAAVTLAGGPIAGEPVQLRVYRDVSEDDLAVDARLIAIKVEYGIIQKSE